MLFEKKIASRAGKDLLAETIVSGASPKDLAQERGLLNAISSDVIENVVLGVIAGNPAAVTDYKAGKQASLEYLLGQCMRELKGAGDPTMLRTLLHERMSS